MPDPWPGTRKLMSRVSDGKLLCDTETGKLIFDDQQFICIHLGSDARWKRASADPDYRGYVPAGKHVVQFYMTRYSGLQPYSFMPIIRWGSDQSRFDVGSGYQLNGPGIMGCIDYWPPGRFDSTYHYMRITDILWYHEPLPTGPYAYSWWKGTARLGPYTPSLPTGWLGPAHRNFSLIPSSMALYEYYAPTLP